MTTIEIVFAILVAIEHFYIMILEMFFIATSVGMRTFWLEKSFVENKKVKTLFANQGLYNGFLASGIIFSLFFLKGNASIIMTIFFLICVIVAAIFGAITSSRNILWKQGLPAIIALLIIICV